MNEIVQLWQLLAAAASVITPGVISFVAMLIKTARLEERIRNLKERQEGFEAQVQNTLTEIKGDIKFIREHLNK